YREAYDKIPYKDLKYANLESVLMMKPDLLVGWRSTFTNKGLRPPAFWQSRHANVYIAESSLGAQSALTMDMEYQYIRDLGRIFNRNMEAEKLIHDMEQSVAHTVAQTAHEKSPKALFAEVQGKHFRLYGHKTLAGNIGDSLHANVIDTDTPSISMEDVVEENPDVIFLIVSDGEYSQADVIMNYVLTQPGLQGVNALRNKRVHFLPLLAVYSPGIRLFDGIDIVSHGLYPNLYPEGVPDLIH
ncbi:ABC transporter substrate-binding protein, partial [Veillonella parvula]|uniref:ABC transporter substrate-binding protein n=1 Tax=Veillonella parvula TaxID=29466 RepID=UPI0007675C47